MILSVEVGDVDAAYADAVTNALTIVLPLRSENWGQRHFCIEDPNGIHIDIVEATDPTGDYQQGYVAE